MKKILIPILVACLFLLTACQQQPTTTNKGSFLGGTQGIIAEFEPFGVEEQGVSSIFDTEKFPLEITLRNKGEYEIKPGEVSVELKGPFLDFEGIPALKLENIGIIDYISDLLPTGGEEMIRFASEAKYKPEVKGLIDREWFANVEFNYQTYLIIPEVCLKRSSSTDTVCEVKGSKTFFVSGAPVTVKTVEEETAGLGIIALRIKVSNAGGGDTAKLGEEFGTYDKFSYSIDDSSWICTSGGRENEARFNAGEAEIICKLRQAIPDGTAATKQVKLTFDYQYRNTIQEKIRIKESAE